MTLTDVFQRVGGILKDDLYRYKRHVNTEITISARAFKTMINSHFREIITFSGIHLLITSFILIVENVANIL